LGDTFILTNPRLPDHPIVLVSDGFADVTGYPKAQVIGRNCRFLQGPGTAPESVQRIRDGLNSGKGKLNALNTSMTELIYWFLLAVGCTELLLNYRRNGEPFYCLLCIIPVYDPSGAIVYFIGGQTNV
ncbi:PAS domain-containing protein, partial [Mycena galopus ATCC 62051]